MCHFKKFYEKAVTSKQICNNKNYDQLKNNYIFNEETQLLQKEMSSIWEIR